jgi:leucyl-tRNA synthetase
MVEYVKEMIKDRKAGNYRTGERTSLDKYFVNRLSEIGAQAYEAYDKTEYKNALKYALYEYQVSFKRMNF